MIISCVSGKETHREEWDILLGRVMASLDDDERDALERRRKVADRARKSGRLSEEGIDVEGVKRFLLLYAKMDRSHGKCLKESGVSKLDLYDAYNLWPEFHFVRCYLDKARKWYMAEIENPDMLDEARDGIRRMNTVEGCELNAKTLIHVNESLDRETFGNAKSSGRDGRSQVTYVIPSLTVNNIMAPDEIAEKVKAKALREAVARGEVVEAEAVLT